MPLEKYCSERKNYCPDKKIYCGERNFYCGESYGFFCNSHQKYAAGIA